MRRTRTRYTQPHGFVAKVPRTFPVLALDVAARYEPLARRRGVSQVARSSRGFFSAFKRAGGRLSHMGKDPHSGQVWSTRRKGFLKRHMAQLVKDQEPLFLANGEPTNRHLALIMWGYSPRPNKL